MIEVGKKTLHGVQFPHVQPARADFMTRRTHDGQSFMPSRTDQPPSSGFTSGLLVPDCLKRACAARVEQIAPGHEYVVEVPL